MAKRRIINTKMWSDNWISNLDPVEKLLFFYLLTNERTNLCGLYELPLKIMAVETGIEKEMVEKVLSRFADDEKVFYFDGWVLVKNFIRYQEKNPSIEAGIKRVLGEIPDNIRETAYRLVSDWGESGDIPKPKLKPELKLKPTDTDVKKAEELILKYIPIKDMSNKTNQRYLTMLYNSAGKDLGQIEFLCRGVEFFKKSPYPYTIYSVRSLYEKKEKILARMEQETLKTKNNSKWHII